MKANMKRFLLRSEYAIQVKIWLKLLNSVTIHKETTCKSSLHSNFIIVTDFHSFTVTEENYKNGEFSSFLLRSRYVIQVKIWKWLKLLNSYPFTKKTLVNQLYIRIWSFLLTFTVSQGMKKNSKNNQFSRILLRS